MTIIRKPIKDRFTIVDNSAIEDKRLSLKSLGLYLKIVSLKDDWSFSEKGLQAAFKCGHAELRTALKQLEECGYIERHKMRDKATGKFINLDWIITEISTNLSTCDFPIMDNPIVDNHTVYNTYLSNTNKTNNYITSDDHIEEYKRAYKDVFNIEHRAVKGTYEKLYNYEPDEIYALAIEHFEHEKYIENCTIDYFETVIDRYK